LQSAITFYASALNEYDTHSARNTSQSILFIHPFPNFHLFSGAILTIVARMAKTYRAAKITL
jgi:hypothetical protein